MNQALFQRLVVLFVITMYRSLHPKLVAFQKMLIKYLFFITHNMII